MDQQLLLLLGGLFCFSSSLFVLEQSTAPVDPFSLVLQPFSLLVAFWREKQLRPCGGWASYVAYWSSNNRSTSLNRPIPPLHQECHIQHVLANYSLDSDDQWVLEAQGIDICLDTHIWEADHFVERTSPDNFHSLMLLVSCAVATILWCSQILRMSPIEEIKQINLVVVTDRGMSPTEEVKFTNFVVVTDLENVSNK